MNNIVEVVTSESGDWTVIKLNGKVYEEGHSIPVHRWLDLIKKFGNEVSSIEISDEDMEEGNY